MINHIMFDRWLEESDWSIIEVILNSLKVVITTVT
jgi:hypothetical protein